MKDVVEDQALHGGRLHGVRQQELRLARDDDGAGRQAVGRVAGRRRRATSRARSTSSEHGYIPKRLQEARAAPSSGESFKASVRSFVGSALMDRFYLSVVHRR